MFFIDMFLKALKGFVWQHVRLEGSMMKGYLVQEAMIKCHDVIEDLD
jgi:hypothetical protein